MSTINWTPRPNDRDTIAGEPGGYLIRVHRTTGTFGTPMPDGSIRYCTVYCGVNAQGYPQEFRTAPSITKAKAYAERHAASKSGAA